MNIRHAFPVALGAALLTSTAVHLPAAGADPSSSVPANQSDRKELKQTQANMMAGTGSAQDMAKRDLSKPSLTPEQQELLLKAMRAKLDELDAMLTESSLSPQEQAALEIALHQKMAAIAAVTVTPTSQTSVEPVRPGKTASQIPIDMEAPALPLTAQQESQLAELLTLYYQDVISPGEYHTRRADIVATN